MYLQRHRPALLKQRGRCGARHEGGERTNRTAPAAAGRTSTLTAKPMNRIDAWRMIQRRAAGLDRLPYLSGNRGSPPISKPGARWRTLSPWRGMKRPRTTKLYDRTGDEITLDEVERIAI
jgi:hypothetical protein